MDLIWKILVTLLDKVFIENIIDCKIWDFKNGTHADQWTRNLGWTEYLKTRIWASVASPLNEQLVLSWILDFRMESRFHCWLKPPHMCLHSPFLDSLRFHTTEWNLFELRTTKENQFSIYIFWKGERHSQTLCISLLGVERFLDSFLIITEKTPSAFHYTRTSNSQPLPLSDITARVQLQVQERERESTTFQISREQAKCFRLSTAVTSCSQLLPSSLFR